MMERAAPGCPSASRSIIFFDRTFSVIIARASASVIPIVIQIHPAPTKAAVTPPPIGTTNAATTNGMKIRSRLAVKLKTIPNRLSCSRKGTFSGCWAFAMRESVVRCRRTDPPSLGCAPERISHTGVATHRVATHRGARCSGRCSGRTQPGVAASVLAAVA